MTELLTIVQLRKQFGPNLLLDIADFRIDTASAYILTGANGAGKSTLLRILAGLESAAQAEIRWRGQPQPLAPFPRVMREAISYVHQHPVMFAASVEHNLDYGLRVRQGLWRTLCARLRLPGMHPPAGAADRHEPDKRAAQIDAALAWGGLTHLRHRHAPGLSGGEKQRLALARARILQPQLLLLDEPTANLDGAAREQVIALIPDLLASGSSVIIACHDRDLTSLPQVTRIKLRDGKIERRERTAMPVSRV